MSDNRTKEQGLAPEQAVELVKLRLKQYADRIYTPEPVTSNPLLAHYEAVYKALNEFRPVTGTEDWVAVRLKALGLLLDNHPSKFRATESASSEGT